MFGLDETDLKVLLIQRRLQPGLPGSEGAPGTERQRFIEGFVTYSDAAKRQRLGVPGAVLKRHGAVSVLQYRDDGFLPGALVNYLVRLGWSHGDEEIFSLQDLIEKFDWEHVGDTAGVFKADTVLAKHDETYMPKDVADALKKQGHWKDDYDKKPPGMPGSPQASQGASK